MDWTLTAVTKPTSYRIDDSTDGEQSDSPWRLTPV